MCTMKLDQALPAGHVVPTYVLSLISPTPNAKSNFTVLRSQPYLYDTYDNELIQTSCSLVVKGRK